MLKHDYVTYKLIPDVSIKNANNDMLAQIMATCYQTPLQRLNKKGMNEVTKFYFDIELSKDSSSFYLTVPQNVEEMVINKAKTIWPKANIHEEALENEFNDSTTDLAELVLKDYNFKSLSTDKGDLFPLTNIMAITKTLTEDEHVRISLCFEPLKRTNWIAKADSEHKAFKSGKRMDREISKSEQLMKLGFQGAETLINCYIGYKMLIFEAILGTIIPDSQEEQKQIINITLNNEDLMLNKLDGINHQSTYKRTAEAFKTRILILSDSKDKQRRKAGILMAYNAFKDLTGDNELVMRLLDHKHIKSALIRDFGGSEDCILCDKEVAKLIQSEDEFTKKLIHAYLSLPDDAKDKVRDFVTALMKDK